LNVPYCRVMKPGQVEPRPPSRGHKHICLPFESEAHYRACVEHLTQYREYLMKLLALHPEIFPQAMAAGFSFHDTYHSRKQPGLRLRRIKLTHTSEVFTLRPSFAMPYLIARTEEVEKALYLRQWDVPFEAMAYVFGRNAMFWYRAWLAFGRPSLVGSTVKAPERMPEHLVADEKITWLDGAEVCVPTTAGGGCVLGMSLAPAADGAALKAAYGEFAAEAAELFPDYQPLSVCTDGWAATREAWRKLFPKVTLVLCFLHSILKIADRCRGALRHEVLDKAWEVYRATTRGAFAQRVRRLREWSRVHLEGAVAEVVEKLCARRADFLPAYDCPGAARTSNAVDRLLNVVDRHLYAMRYCHGTTQSARLAVRAMGMQWNFHPYGSRLRREGPERVSPFADLNGFQYHSNWLHNFLIASSMGGLRL
jgi:hypothetical protein